jgi:hypothetical protein
MIAIEYQFLAVVAVLCCVAGFYLFRKRKEQKRVEQSRKARQHKKFQLIPGGINQEELFELVKGK